MKDALVIGGTRFVGRHLVEELRAHDYDVTIFNRGESENPFADTDVDHVRGDRRERADVERAAESDPDVVFDVVAYYPEDVRVATDLFADARYVYVSSGSAYAESHVPMREGETPLEPCTDEQATDDSLESYGARKAECDREVFRAAEAGVAAMAVRPMLVYGPHDYTERFAYWVRRAMEDDRVLVPGDGASLLHRVYVEDVASALRAVAEAGEAGEAYNVADRRAFTLADSVELAAEAGDTDVEVVTAGAETLAEEGLDPGDFPLYVPGVELAAVEKLSALGWESTPPADAMARTVEAVREEDRHGPEEVPDAEAVERVLGRM